MFLQVPAYGLLPQNYQIFDTSMHILEIPIKDSEIPSPKCIRKVSHSQSQIIKSTYKHTHRLQ